MFRKIGCNVPLQLLQLIRPEQRHHNLYGHFYFRSLRHAGRPVNACFLHKIQECFYRNYAHVAGPEQCDLAEHANALNTPKGV